MAPLAPFLIPNPDLKFNGLNNVDWRWMVMLCQMTGSIYNGITHGEFMLKQSIELVPWDSPEEMAYRIK